MKNAYSAITATTATESNSVSFEEIQQALEEPSISPIRLEWQASVSSIVNSKAIGDLQDHYQRVRNLFDHLILALKEVEKTSTKGLDEAQYQQRIAVVDSTMAQTASLKKRLRQLDQKITYLDDSNNDLQMRFRENMGKYLSTLTQTHEQFIDSLLAHIKTLDIDIDENDLRQDLQHLLKQPEIQAEFMAAAQGQSNTGLFQKLKGLLT